MQLNVKGKRKLNDSRTVIQFLTQFLHENLYEADKECMWAICLDLQNRVIAIDLVYIGTSSGLPIRVAELFRLAVECGSSKIIIVHNHPGGSLQFTEQDLTVKTALVKAGELLQITVVDFIVFIRNGQFISAMA